MLLHLGFCIYSQYVATFYEFMPLLKTLKELGTYALAHVQLQTSFLLVQFQARAPIG